MNIISGNEIVRQTPIGGSGHKWEVVHSKNDGWCVKYYTIVRGWKFCVWKIHNGTYACEVDDEMFDVYNFGFAQKNDAMTLLSHLLTPADVDFEEILEKAYQVMRSNRTDFWKRMSLRKLMYVLIKGNATRDTRRTLHVLVEAVYNLPLEDDGNLVDLLGYGNAVEFILA